MYTTNTFTIMKTNDIKIGIMFAICIVIACIGISVMCTSCTTATAQQTADSLAIYNNYFDLTEKLLDEIEVETGWSTSYADNGKEEQTTYYEARWNLKNTKLTTLTNTLELNKWYYRESQKLLLMLDNDYNWSDTVAEGDLYVEWCKILKQIK